MHYTLHPLVRRFAATAPVTAAVLAAAVLLSPAPAARANTIV
jgi:hypothetical protein